MIKTLTVTINLSSIDDKYTSASAGTIAAEILREVSHSFNEDYKAGVRTKVLFQDDNTVVGSLTME